MTYRVDIWIDQRLLVESGAEVGAMDWQAIVDRVSANFEPLGIQLRFRSARAWNVPERLESLDSVCQFLWRDGEVSRPSESSVIRVYVPSSVDWVNRPGVHSGQSEPFGSSVIVSAAFLEDLEGDGFTCVLAHEACHLFGGWHVASEHSLMNVAPQWQTCPGLDVGNATAVAVFASIRGRTPVDSRSRGALFSLIEGFDHDHDAGAVLPLILYLASRPIPESAKTFLSADEESAVRWVLSARANVDDATNSFAYVLLGVQSAMTQDLAGVRKYAQLAADSAETDPWHPVVRKLADTLLSVAAVANDTTPESADRLVIALFELEQHWRESSAVRSVALRVLMDSTRDDGATRQDE